jgi:hypothetical protein
VENIDAKFRAAWEVFGRTCAGAVAPEATFQAWFAHYLISQFGIDRRRCSVSEAPRLATRLSCSIAASAQGHHDDEAHRDGAGPECEQGCGRR